MGPRGVKAVEFLHGYDAGRPILKTARFANALGALVPSRAGATPQWTFDEVISIIEALNLLHASRPNGADYGR